MRDLTKRQCRIRENVDGMRDLTKRQCGIRENVDGMRDLTKRQCGIRENVDRMRDLTASREAKFAKIYLRIRIEKEDDVRDSDDRSSGFGIFVIKEQESPFPDSSLISRRVVKTYRHTLFVVQ